MIKACKLACLDEFINNLPQKYDTIVGEGGVTLSGGQRQRLAIARALIQNTKIILFDEATSALDNESEEEIQNLLDTIILNDKMRVIIIAHKLKTVKKCDRCYKMKNGKIVKVGTLNEICIN